jgi:hypothetical protein
MKDMSQTPLYPLRFEPIYQYRLWGSRRLADLLTAPLPGDGPIGDRRERGVSLPPGGAADPPEAKV